MPTDPVQVLPDDIMILAEPTPVALVQALDRALVEAPAIDRQAQHHRVGIVLIHSPHCRSLQQPDTSEAFVITPDVYPSADEVLRKAAPLPCNRWRSSTAGGGSLNVLCGCMMTWQPALVMTPRSPGCGASTSVCTIPGGMIWRHACAFRTFSTVALTPWL